MNDWKYNSSQEPTAEDTHLGLLLIMVDDFYSRKINDGQKVFDSGAEGLPERAIEALANVGLVKLDLEGRITGTLTEHGTAFLDWFYEHW